MRPVTQSPLCEAALAASLRFGGVLWTRVERGPWVWSAPSYVSYRGTLVL